MKVAPHVALVALLLFCAVRCETSTLSSSFTNFKSPEGLYELIYEARVADIVTDTGAIDESRLIDLVHGMPQLKEVMETTGILAGYAINYDAVKAYLDSNLELRNLLVREGVIDSTGGYSASAVKSIAERFNPTTKTLDPVVSDGSSTTSNSTSSKPLSITDIKNIKLETASDVYELVLKAYASGLFDQEGNFVESSFAALMKQEPNLYNIFKNEKLCDENYRINAINLESFISSRPQLVSLLEESGIYKEKKYNAKAVSDIILRYNPSTKKLDQVPTTPVVDQIPISADAQKEIIEKQETADDNTTPLQIYEKLMENPKSYLRRTIGYGRRNGVFDSEGNFDYFTFYNLLGSDEKLMKISDAYGIFDGAGNFVSSNLLRYVESSPALKAACIELGVLTQSGKYSQETVLGITSQYQSRYEVSAEPFNVLRPETCQTTDDVLSVLSRGYTMGVFDDNGDVVFDKLSAALADESVLRNSLGSYGIVDGNTIKASGLHMMIRERPLLRKALVALGIVDAVGAFDKEAFKRAISRAKTTAIAMNTPTVSNSTSSAHLTQSQLDRMENAINNAVNGQNSTSSTLTTTGIKKDNSETEVGQHIATTESLPINSYIQTNAINRSRTSNELETVSNNTSKKTYLIVLSVAIGGIVVVALIVMIAVKSSTGKKKEKVDDDEEYNFV